MQFEKVVAVSKCNLVGPARIGITELSKAAAVLDADDPANAGEVVSRIGDADCVLVSWRTPIGRDILDACPSIKYIGLCCSLYGEQSSNVDLVAAQERGIVVTGVKDYGDEGTVEFIFASLINLYLGLGKRWWSDEPTELAGKTLGIVGMGTVGRMVAAVAKCFGMNVLYYSRTRKQDVEAAGAGYRELGELLPQCDVVTVHLPRNAQLFGEDEFALMRGQAVFVNTSLGQPYDEKAFFDWIRKRSGNYAVFDLSGSGTLAERFRAHENIILHPRSSGLTAEAKVRLTEKVLQNMVDFLRGYGKV